MAIEAFSKAIKSQIYKTWLDTLNKNIIKNTVDSLRTSQQAAAKTDFYISKNTVKDMYKTVTGLGLSDTEAEIFLKELAKPGKGPSGKEGVFINVAGSKAVKFESIGFETITTKLVSLFNAYDEVQDAYKLAEDQYIEREKQVLDQDKSLRGRAKQLVIDKIEREGKRQGSFGYYFNKGHVVSLATNLTKDFRDQIQKADNLAIGQQKVLLEVLDKYINKLQADDLASANLPNAIDQELYAGYIKSGSKYLVEIQSSTKNIESGRASIAVVEELRNIFSMTDNDVSNILNKSPALGTALLTTPGSPTFVSLMAQDLASIMSGGSKSNKIYTVAPILIAKNSVKLTKPKKNTAEIAKLKAIKNKVRSVKSDPKKIVLSQDKESYSLVGLQQLINDSLQNVISANMGSGTSAGILNYQTGRFAASARVEGMTQSREGMITAFYSYMKNPYQTFEPGYAQGSPKTRDPKLLIAKSIREIAATKVGNRLRAVST